MLEVGDIMFDYCLECKETTKHKVTLETTKYGGFYYALVCSICGHKQHLTSL